MKTMSEDHYKQARDLTLDLFQALDELGIGSGPGVVGVVDTAIAALFQLAPSTGKAAQIVSEATIHAIEEMEND